MFEMGEWYPHRSGQADASNCCSGPPPPAALTLRGPGMTSSKCSSQHKTVDCGVSTSQHWFLPHCRQHLGLQGPSLTSYIPLSPKSMAVSAPAGMPCLHHLLQLYLHHLPLHLHPQTVHSFNTARFRLRPWMFSLHTPQRIQGHP